MPPKVKVLAFAGARDVVGASELELDLHHTCTGAELIDLLCVRFPALAAHKSSLRIAVNGCYAELVEPVRPGDEVALIPPVAGG
jgi:molybdopterin synthase catalytic subunit/molybdopterin synthase sulfur carrier subunit